jgi:hypothetical protein
MALFENLNHSAATPNLGFFDIPSSLSVKANSFIDTLYGQFP